MEIEQTARQLETNAHANFPMAENAAYQCMENGGGKHAHIDRFVAHCVCRVQCWDKVKDLEGVPREHAECFLSIVGHTNAEQWYH